MVWIVLPLSWISKPFTFSKKNAFGRLRRRISATSKNNVPRVSSNPNLLPAKENAWQGKPAQSTSKLSGINAFVDSLVISPKGTSP